MTEIKDILNKVLRGENISYEDVVLSISTYLEDIEYTKETGKTFPLNQIRMLPAGMLNRTMDVVINYYGNINGMHVLWSGVVFESEVKKRWFI